MRALLTIVSLALVLCSTISCQDKAAMAELEAFRAQAKDMEDNRATANRFMDEIGNRGDLSAIDEMIDEKFVNHSPVPGISSDRAGFRTFTKQIHEGFSDINYVTNDLIAEGDKVVIRGTFNSRNTGGFMGAPATGSEVTMTFAVTLRIKDGKIIERWGNADELGLNMQLGMELKPAEQRLSAITPPPPLPAK